MRYLVIVLLLCGCSESIDPAPAEIIDDFKPFVAEFRQYYIGPWPPYLSIKYGEPITPYAECDTNESFMGKKTILIRFSMWMGMEHEQKTATMFHELAHCVLNRIDHSTDQMSYMFPDLRTEQFYKDNKQTLINELF